MRVLVIGATGRALYRVGSAALEACLAKSHDVTAFVGNPAKLPPPIQSHPRVRIVKGDATSHASVVEAIRNQDAIIEAAIYGSNSPFGDSDSEKAIRCIINAIKEVQATRPAGATPIRLWLLSEQVLLDIPGGKGRVEGDVIPVHPEYYKSYAFLQPEASDVDWTLLCPGKIEHGEVRVWLYQCR
ncbi:MAG: hypothetical protein Q9163_003362 [Psora crenata]